MHYHYRMPWLEKYLVPGGFLLIVSFVSKSNYLAGLLIFLPLFLVLLAIAVHPGYRFSGRIKRKHLGTSASRKGLRLYSYEIQIEDGSRLTASRELFAQLAEGDEIVGIRQVATNKILELDAEIPERDTAGLLKRVHQEEETMAWRRRKITMIFLVILVVLMIYAQFYAN